MTKEERQERDLPEGIVRRSGTPTLYMRFMVNGERVSLSTGETLVKRAVAVMEAKKVDIKKRQHTESLFSPVEREMLAEEREKVKVRKPTMTFPNSPSCPMPRPALRAASSGPGSPPPPTPSKACRG